MTTEEWYTNAAAQTPSRTLTYDYDWLGRLTGTSDPSADYVFQYDELDRLLSSTIELPDIDDVVLTSQYDSRGNRTQLAAVIGTTDDFVNNYVYDALSRVKSITQEQQSGGNEVADKQVGLIYGDAGQLLQINRFNQLVTTDPESPYTELYDESLNPYGAISISNYTYDGAGRLTDLVTQYTGAPTSPIEQTWDYDFLNRVTQYTNDSDSAINGGVIDYDYDDLHQLTEEAGGTTENYTYDENGNRTMTGYVTAPGNRLVDDGTYTYVYDDEGNLTDRYFDDSQDPRHLEFFWDHRNRLTSIVERNAGGTILYQLDYEYDTLNRRVAREQTINEVGPSGGEGGGTVVVDSEVTAERFIYDGQHVVLDFYQPDGRI
jgi:YD repeat-containing protein